MADLAYREVYVMNAEKGRQRLVMTYQKTGCIAETARRWHISRQVVRKWLLRFRRHGSSIAPRCPAPIGGSDRTVASHPA